MKKLIISFFIFSLPLLIFSQTSDDYLSAALQTANWLISLEQEESLCNGLSWPQSTISDTKATGLGSGAAGIGLFFLKLYQSTGNNNYLQKARGAANFINKKYINHETNGPDWLSGAAGGGDFFIDLYKETKNSNYLQMAKTSAQWLMEEAYTDNSGYYWKHYPTITKIYTGIAHGAAGIGLFFLNLYEQDSSTIYLQYAEGAFDWLTHYAIDFDDSSLGWKRLTKDAHAYHLWCGGSTGIIFFLEKLYHITQKPIYIEYLKKTANGLIKYAHDSNGSCCWYYTTEGGSFPIIYCHGTSSTAHAFFLSYSLLRDTKYFNYARRGAEWVKKVRKEYNSSSYYWAHIYNWDQFDTGLLTGTASVGHAFLNYYKYDPTADYITYAKAAADYLRAIADTPAPDQMRWINYTNPLNKDYDLKAYHTGWYYGAAGIGIFLLELYEALQSTDIKDPCLLPPDNFTMKCYPNPFNNRIKIKLNLQSDCYMVMEIYNIIGIKVKTLINNQFYPRGTWLFSWEGNDNSDIPLPTGIYFIQVNAKKQALVKKVLIIK